MRLTFGRAFAGAALLALFAGVSLAGASSKFAYTEAIQFPSGDLVVTFNEGSQKRFSSVDYQLTATAIAKSCDPTGVQCIAELYNPVATVTGLVPDAKGQVTATLTLDQVPVGGGGVCTCSLHMEYSDLVLTNLTSGHVYGLDPISGDSP